MEPHRFHKFDPANAARLLSDDRAQMHPPAEALAMLDLHPGQVVADVGCGPGFLTIPIARLVQPGGRVFAVDIRPEMLALLRERLAAEGIAHVRPVLSQESLLPLHGESCGRVLATFLLHELEDPAAFLRELRRVLRPGGRGLAVDWAPARARSGRRWTPGCLRTARSSGCGRPGSSRTRPFRSDRTATRSCSTAADGRGRCCAGVCGAAVERLAQRPEIIGAAPPRWERLWWS